VRALTPIPDDSALHGGEPRQTTCGGCELLCEDLTVQSIKTGTGCTVADSWFASGASPSETTIDGKRASLHEAINIAAKRLLSSHQPLLTGLTSTTLDAIQTACRIADYIDAAVDANAHDNSCLTAPTTVRVGKVSADFEELRDRADLAIFWGVDPFIKSTRFIERFLQPMLQDGSRRIISVGITPTLPPSLHNLHFPVPEDQLVSLARLVDAQLTHKNAGNSSCDLHNIANQLKKLIGAARCVGFVSTPTTETTGLVNWSLSQLIRSLAHQKPCFEIPLKQMVSLEGGNLAGASAVCTWRFGSSGAIPLASSSGSMFLPAEADAQRLIKRNEVDCIFIVGRIPPQIKELVNRSSDPKTIIHITDESNQTMLENSVQLCCASLSDSTKGSMLRSDGRLISLRPFMPADAPSIQDILNQLLHRVVADGRNEGST
jgi:formylmethanofuran dehydrogenase subunit B